MAGKKPLRDHPHVRLYQYELESAAYRSLTPDARALLVELRSLYTGRSNRVHMSLREGMRRLGVGRVRVENARDALIERGFIRLLTPGSFTRKIRHAPEYALLHEPLDGERVPEKPFMRWKPGDGDSRSQKNTVSMSNTDGVDGQHRKSASVLMSNTVGAGEQHREGQKVTALGVGEQHTDSYQVGGGYGGQR